jgi:hypothetical protein
MQRLFPAVVLAVSDRVSRRLEPPLFCPNSPHFPGLASRPRAKQFRPLRPPPTD